MIGPTQFVIALVLAGVASLNVSAQTPDPFVGTWKLNVAKSKTTFSAWLQRRRYPQQHRQPPGNASD